MNATRIFTGIFALIISLVFLGAGLWIQFFRTSGYESTRALITKIETSSSPMTGTGNHRSRTHRTAYIEYVVDGNTYSGPSDIYESGMREGQMVTIYYNPDNPAQMAGDPGFLGWMFIGIGGISVLGSIAMMFTRRDG